MINSLEMIVDDEMANAFKEILLKRVVPYKKVLRISIPFSLEYIFDHAKEKLSSVLQKALNLAVEEVAKMTREKVIVVDRYDKLASKDMTAIALPEISERYINGARSYLAGKGYKVFSFSESLSGKLLELYNEIAEPTIPDEVKAMIKLAEWLYSIGVELMKMYFVPGWLERVSKVTTGAFGMLDPLPGIFDTDVKVVKPQYNDLLTDSVGVTLVVNNKTVIILKNLQEHDRFLYVGIMLHELNHVYTNFEHGTFQWENIYNVLYMVDVLDPAITPYVTNIIRLAMYNPKLFLKVNDVLELPPHVLPRDLIESGECIGYIDDRGVVCNETSSTIVKLVNDNGILKVEVVPL
jgi:hypothetical protein